MNIASLSVRFENLLPSEELLGFARQAWASLDVASYAASSPATLSITRGRGERFRVRLAFTGATDAQVEAHGVNPFVAVREALGQLSHAPRGARHACA